MWAGPAHGPLFLVQIVADRRKTVADRQQETLMKELEDVRFGVTRYWKGQPYQLKGCVLLPFKVYVATSHNLVGGWATPLKNISQLDSIGMIIPIYGKIKNGNQTTNQQYKSEQKRP